MLKKNYHLHDFSSTHNQFLFRSYDDLNGVNHDLLFEGVEFIAIPFSFHLLGINQQAIELIPESTVICTDKKTVTLDFENGEGYVRLFRILYQVNSLPPSETSIPIKREKPLTMEAINEVAEDVKRIGYEEWQKLNSKNDWERIV